MILLDDDKIICTCLSVTQGMVRDAVKEGAVTVEDIQSKTDAGTICGACLDSIQEFLDSIKPE